MTTPRVRAELERLIADGLDRYRRGDVDGALLSWEAALQVAPGDSRALGYVDYVRQNYEHLLAGAPRPVAEQLVPFELAAADDSGDYDRISITRGEAPAAGPTTWRGARLAEPAIDDGWPIDHERSAIGLPPAPTPGLPPGRTPTPRTVAPPPRRGGAPTQPPRRAAATRPPPIAPPPGDDHDGLQLGSAGRSDPALATARADDSGESTLGGYRRGAVDAHTRPTVDLNFDFGGREVTGEPTLERSAMPAPRRTAPLGAAPWTPPVPERPPAVPERPPPVQTLRGGATRPPAPARPSSATFAAVEPLPVSAPYPPAPSSPAIQLPDPLDELELGLGLSLDLDLPGSPLELGIETLVPGLDPPAPVAPVDDRAVHVEELRLPPPLSQRMQVVDNVDEPAPLPPLSSLGGPSAQLLADIDRDRPPRESADDAARRRITRLIERARAAATGGEPAQVIVAIELALAEAPDSAVAQKLIHKNRDVLLDCYYRFFGSLERRPVVTGTLSDLKGGEGKRGVDPRAAFLLSRIDGMLTFDELLDVAGMGRLEACRHLANLIGRGLVRST